jgi:hypothetical protein
VPPAEIEAGAPEVVNGEEEPEANENVRPLIEVEPGFKSVTVTEPVVPIGTLPTPSVVTGEPPIVNRIGAAFWKAGSLELVS